MTERKPKSYIPFGRTKLPRRPQKLPPHIDQLRDGHWAVFNMEGTPLWSRIFKSETAARAALREYLRRKAA